MNENSIDIESRPFFGFDPWCKGKLWRIKGCLPSTARFLCTFDVFVSVETVAVDLYANRPDDSVLEIWESALGLPHRLLGRTKVDDSTPHSEQYVDSLYEICHCWLGTKVVQRCAIPGLFSLKDWKKLDAQLKTEWLRTGQQLSEEVRSFRNNGSNEKASS